ncbi:MAG: hypothetical protein HFE51_05040 [Clostridia bacterium]|nr:hypothetical protein [Clostridia bacterium]
MRDAIDKTSQQSGTLINRAFLMGIQDFVGVEITFGNGKMTVNNDTGEKIEYTYNADENSITKTMIGDKRLSLKLKYTENGITGVIS